MIAEDVSNKDYGQELLQTMQKLNELNVVDTNIKGSDLNLNVNVNVNETNLNQVNGNGSSDKDSLTINCPVLESTLKANEKRSYDHALAQNDLFFNHMCKGYKELESKDKFEGLIESNQGEEMNLDHIFSHLDFSD